MLGSSLRDCQYIESLCPCALQESLTLCPSHSLFPKGSKGVWRHLVRNDVHVVHGFPAIAVCSQCRIDVFGQHVAVHLQVADDI